jgi:two-component system cell cycle sensor histidine kinase/response regulator CckA
VLDVRLSLLGAGPEAQVLAMVRDLSERRDLEDKLRQSQKLEAVGRLAGGIAHDFNNILMVIQGQCDLILMGPHARQAEDPLREDLHQIRDAARRAAELTRQLLAFSRKQTLHPQKVSLNRALADVERMLRRVLGEHVTIHMELGEDLHAVSVDPGQLDQVVVNLAVNARDAMPGGGRLNIVTANETLDEAIAQELGVAPGPHVRLDMRDTGHGMDAQTLAHIFEPFYTTKEPGKGTGLGLATVYGIVSQSGGALKVESQPGQGTVFHIYLPASRHGEEAFLFQEQPGLDTLGGSESILLVEDENAVRDVLQRTLENHGYQVLVAEEGQHALDLLLGGLEVDLVLCDVVMPVLGGMDLAQAFRTLGRRTPIVLMTGYTDHPLDGESCRQLELGVLMKPFGPRTLLTELRARLGQAQEA